MHGFVLAALSLAVLEAAASSTGAAKRAGTILGIPAKVARYIISPAVPAIPELRKKSGGAGKSASTADNPFSQAKLNSELISATWSTQSSAASAVPAVTTAPLSPQTMGV